MFILKKMVAPFFMPVSVVILLALVGLFCLWFTKRQKTGKVFVTVAIAMLGLLSYTQVTNLLTKPLEKQYPPVLDYQALKDIKWILVLGGGSEVDRGLPLSSYRLQEKFFRVASRFLRTSGIRTWYKHGSH